MSANSEPQYVPIKAISGGCLCGQARYTIVRQARQIVNCFCSQCQKTSGNHVAATKVAKQDLRLDQSDSLTWFSSSKGVRRGFCNQCGGNLFFENSQQDHISVMAGSLDHSAGLPTVLNLHVEDASAYHIVPALKALE